MSSKKRARTLLDEINGLPNNLDTSQPNILAELLARVSQLEDSQEQVSSLKNRVAVLEARVKELEGEAIRAEDRNFNVGRSVSRTMLAIREGETTTLAQRLHRGADPNHDDGLGGTCLIHSVARGRPECTRLLVEHGADVSYCFRADNASVLYMLARAFETLPTNVYREGDFVLAADLLVDAGAPIDEVDDEAGTALSVLEEMEVREGTRRSRERDGLVAVLQRRYWPQHHGFNPFLRVPSPDASAWLLLKGAADKPDGSIDITRMRSIKPDWRNDVLNTLGRMEGLRKTFAHIVLTIKDPTSESLFGSLRGHESTILPLIASFAGSRGWSSRKLKGAKTAIREAIDRFNVDGGSDESLDGEGDDEGDDDDSYEVVEDDDNSHDARDEENMDELVDTDDDGDY